ncbi:putative quinol monooxygenase [Pseudonocardia benzenivorans]|jgi:quinol monooxygenase YgiN|uniref:Antibiotic biosynthesis monooxygenase n=2 Tax=Pseudonocardia TaxID=1847 RepID=F4CNC6_PSEUX|nr:putative quinol monooxygenase [Pseudonocardia dioxanivorans]AEA27150.1 Antibiotic biosynthesis monooxygenase [Pseudonocardia dioxanivorans CB1190]GJF07227.1 antibiotic biosynthesis monooxygenase [Pseudonocardia sp. D17]
MIFIALKAKIRPEKRDEWLAGIKQYTADVNAEPGCISFEYFESTEHPNQFAIIESFVDSDAGSAHVGMDHVKKFFEWMPYMVAERPKIIYQELEGWNDMAEVTPAE